jgi:hypothetical protein
MESSLIVLQHCKARQPTPKPACGDYAHVACGSHSADEFDFAECPLSGGDLNRSTQHLLILLDKEVADGDVTDIVHGEAEG